MKKLARILLIILLIWLFAKNAFGYHPETFSFPVAMYSIHSNASDMNENHKPMGFCLGHFCHVEFLNSFYDRGSIDYIDARFSESWYLSGWMLYRIMGGLRFGFIWGYNWDPVPCLIPYFGLSYRGRLPFILTLENSTIPAVDGSNHYLTLTLFKIEVEI